MKQITAILLVLLLAMAMAGCGGSGQSASSSGKTKTVTDSMGRTVEIPENPQRVACLYATAAHMMAMLDEGDKIVGCPNGVKSDVLMQMKYPQITETATPHQEGAINVEELLNIEADLAMISYSLAESEGEMAKLDEMGIPYVVVDYTNIQELKAAVRTAGAVFGKEEKAEKYLDFFDETIDLVDQRLEPVLGKGSKAGTKGKDGESETDGKAGADEAKQKLPRVYHSVNEATRTDPEGTICSEIMERAGVEDISVSQGMSSAGKNAYVTLEEIYKWDPDAVIANEYSVTDYILSDSKWEGLTAVKKKRVYTLPVGATRWCHPGSMEAHMGVLAVAWQFYPEQFKDFDLEKYTRDYYQEYFDLELDDKTVAKILAGEGMRASNSPTE